jgi:hypothetical protein
MDWCVIDEHYRMRIAAFRSVDELERGVDGVVERGGLALLFDEGLRYGDGRIFIDANMTLHLPYFVSEEGVLVGAIGLVTPWLERPRFHAIERVNGLLVIVGQSPIAFSYDSFTARYRDLHDDVSAYVRSLRALRA